MSRHQNARPSLFSDLSWATGHGVPSVNGAPVVNEGYARAEGSTRQRYLQTFKELYGET